MDLCTSVSMKINHISCDNNYEYRKSGDCVKKHIFFFIQSHMVRCSTKFELAGHSIWYNMVHKHKVQDKQITPSC